MDLEDGLQSMNAELRFITLELMKIAEKRGVTFKEVAGEYVTNVHLMQKLIDDSIKSSQIINEPESSSD